jgi:hypothetical protein
MLQKAVNDCPKTSVEPLMAQQELASCHEKNGVYRHGVLSGHRHVLPTPLQAADAPSCPLTLYTSLPLTTNPDGRVSVR